MKTSRREFLRDTTAAAVGIPLAVKASHGHTAGGAVTSGNAITMPSGGALDTQIPDTLDFVEKGNLGVCRR